MKMAESATNGQKKLWEKVKLLVTSNFPFSQSVFKGLVLQTRKNKGLFGKGLRRKVGCKHVSMLRQYKLAEQKYSKMNIPYRSIFRMAKTIRLHKKKQSGLD